MVIPVVSAVTVTPTARADADIAAIAASDFITPFSVILNSRKAASTTTGIDTLRGAIPHATAIDNAPYETCESPSPIIEYCLSTRLTPRSAAQSDTSIPTINALTIKGYDIICIIISSILNTICI